MTTPSGAATPTGSGLLGGAAGTIAGTNPLQQSIDQLTNAVNSLSNQISSANFGAGSMGSSTGTSRQQQSASQRFPSMINPFQSNAQQPGMGGGGPGGSGNVSSPTPFGSAGIAMMAGAVTQFGQNQMNPLLTLNQYATSSMLGMNMNGMSQNQAMQMMYKQAGVTSGQLNTIATSPQDAIQSMQTLQQLAGSANISGTSIGRAGLGAQAAFGMTNPTLSATASSQLAAALYSPQFSQNMLSLGYSPIRSMTGGAPMNSGSAAQSILKGLGLNGMSQSNLYGNLTSGRGQASLSALFGSSGISNTQAATFLEGYNQLFSKGLNASQATQLFSQAASGSLSQVKAAQSKLAKLGVSVSDNDLQAMKTSQSVTTGRESQYAGGFNNAIQDSTGLLEKFNSMLTSILGDTGLGGVLGYGGGMGGVLSGTSHAVGLAGTAGGLLSIGRLLGIGGGAAGAGGALGGIGGGAGIAGGGAALAGLSVAATAAASALVLSKIHSFNPQAPKLNQLNQFFSKQSAGPGNSGSGWNSWSGLGHDITSLWGLLGSSHPATKGGGAAGAPQANSMQQSQNNNNQMGSASSSARAAVGAARTQLGVPYVYGDEIPNVGFDCSGLVQWAYKQAGISLPRTSQAMWETLRNKRVPLNQVQEGDLLFTAGSDGTTGSPGHVGMMVSGNQLIQAPKSGENVQIIGYHPDGWLYAARPSGRGSFIAGGSGGSQLGGVSSGGSGTGNRGISTGGSGGTYGSSNEVDLINAMGNAGGGSFYGNSGSSNGSSGGGNTIANSVGNTKTPSNAAGVVAMAKQMAKAYGWSSGLQWNDFVSIVNAESGWNVHASNPSGAYGIPQALPGNKMASAGSDWANNPATQLKWMFGYIKGRYGSPSRAWAHEQADNWYGQGGMVQPGLSIVGERGPELMMTSGGKSQVFSNAQTMALINSIKGNVPQNPWKTDVTSGGSSSSSSGQSFNINFNPGSIVIQSDGTGSTGSVASKAGREVARQIVKHINTEAVHNAIRSGDKL